MRLAVERGARTLWSGDGGTAGALFSMLAIPAELAFRAGVSMRGAAYESGIFSIERAPVPVISVGNLAVGGTGKTPLVRWVVGVLCDAGKRPAVVLRGYARDETMLHRGWNHGLPVIADRDRANAARDAASAGAEVVVLDDGFQHRRLARELDVVALAAEHRFPGPLLPRGPYRESASALGRAGLIVVTHRSAPASAVARLEAAARRVAPGAVLARVRLAPGRWEDLRGAPVPAPRGDVLAATGVAGPEGFAALVRGETRANADLLAFPDHHEFSSADLERIGRTAGGRPVAITEKDAVKLRERPSVPFEVCVLTLAVVVESGEAAMRDRILAAAEGGKR